MSLSLLRGNRCLVKPHRVWQFAVGQQQRYEAATGIDGVAMDGVSSIAFQSEASVAGECFDEQ